MQRYSNFFQLGALKSASNMPSTKLQTVLNSGTMKGIKWMVSLGARYLQCTTSEVSQRLYNSIATLKIFREKKKDVGKGAILSLESET